MRIDEILYKYKTIQDRLKVPDNATSIAKISKKIQVSNEQRKCEH